MTQQRPTKRLRTHKSGPLVRYECGHESNANFTIMVDGQVVATQGDKRQRCLDCQVSHMSGDKPEAKPAAQRDKTKGTPPGVQPEGMSIGPEAPTPIIPHRTIPPPKR